MGANDTDHGQPPPAAQPASGASLWTLQKSGRLIECALRVGAGQGVEVQIRRDGQLCVVQEFDEPAAAVAHANSLRQDLGLHGWMES